MSEAAIQPRAPRASAPRGTPRQLQIVQAAEQVLLRSPGERAVPLNLVHRWIGVSARTLHHAFACVHGVSPGRYLRFRRLALVRDALLAAPEKPSAVKQAAMALGFRNLGNFARAYREYFGELPSETVARGRSGLDNRRGAAARASSSTGSVRLMGVEP